ncbi:MAG TPA: hypothetical protein VGM09_09770 [Bradyrhizobium sp.]|jgi:hypothetical protein
MTASAVGSSSLLAPSQSHSTSKPASKPTNAATAFQQSLNKYLQNTTSGAGGATGANPTQTLSSSLMSSLLQMQA